MGDNSCSVNALSVPTTTITSSFRGVAIFYKCNCLQGKEFKLHKLS